MEVQSQTSARSRRSNRSTSTLSSLLSNQSLDLVFGLIDDYYTQNNAHQHGEDAMANLLGNMGPMRISQGRTDRGLDTLAAAVHEHEQSPQTKAVVARALTVVHADRTRLEELFMVLNSAQMHASCPSSSSQITRDQRERLDKELVEVKDLLTELKAIQVCHERL